MSRGRGRCGLHPSPHHLRQRGGCGGVGIWYKHWHSLPGTGPLGRSGRPEDGVRVSSLEVQLFQVLTSSLTALPLVPSSLGHQGAPRGQEPLWVPQLVTWDCFAGPHVRRLHPSPAPACHLQKACRLMLLLACCSPALLWPVCNGVAAWPSLLEAGVRLGEEGRTRGLLVACGGAATALCCLHTSTSLFHPRAQRAQSSLLGNQGEQKLFLCQVLGFQ